MKFSLDKISITRASYSTVKEILEFLSLNGDISFDAVNPFTAKGFPIDE